MNTDDVLQDYVTPKKLDTLHGQPITKDTYEAIIIVLQHEEAKSFGIIKHDSTIRFLQDWFS